MINCDCYRIDGGIIGADPCCPLHGTEAEKQREQLDELNDLKCRVQRLETAMAETHSIMQELMKLLKEL
jgi:hypothetical protein